MSVPMKVGEIWHIGKRRVEVMGFYRRTTLQGETGVLFRDIDKIQSGPQWNAETLAEWAEHRWEIEPPRKPRKGKKLG